MQNSEKYDHAIMFIDQISKLSVLANSATRAQRMIKIILTMIIEKPMYTL